jgi:hypothetical protein
MEKSKFILGRDTCLTGAAAPWRREGWLCGRLTFASISIPNGYSCLEIGFGKRFSEF